MVRFLDLVSWGGFIRECDNNFEEIIKEKLCFSNSEGVHWTSYKICEIEDFKANEYNRRKGNKKEGFINKKTHGHPGLPRIR